jgi:hypothetical protein
MADKPFDACKASELWSALRAEARLGDQEAVAFLKMFEPWFEQQLRDMPGNRRN